MTTKVAVVTGANKGIGFEIVRGLCKRFEGVVYLTSGNMELGKQAVADLEKEGLYPIYHRLDVTDKQGLEVFGNFIKDTYGGIDILVNNAAIVIHQDKESTSTEPVSVQAKETLFVNYFTLLSTCDILFPILRIGARVINVSSAAGHLSKIPSQALRDRIKDENLTVVELSSLMQEFVEAAKQGTHAAEWGNSTLAVSKVGVTALSNIQQRLLNKKDIKVNSVHPDYLATDLTSSKGALTIDKGAETALYLALDAPNTFKGEYVWFNGWFHKDICI